MAQDKCGQHRNGSNTERSANRESPIPLPNTALDGPVHVTQRLDLHRRLLKLIPH
jgi:hypothetical protein